MFRLTFVFALIFCSSAIPLNSNGNSWKINRSSSFDDPEIVDNDGAGYSYFKKQQIEVNQQGPMANPLTNLDMSEYMRSSALNTRTIPTGFPQQQQQINRPFSPNHQSDFSSVFNQNQRNVFGQIPHQDVQTWSNQQGLMIPQTNLNFQQKVVNNPWSNLPVNQAPRRMNNW